MKAFKVFNSDWKCRDFQYVVGETYELSGELVICKNGFHACEKLSDCFSYYSFDPSNKVAEVEFLGDVVGVDGDKQATNKIKIVRELSWEEVLREANSGNRNSGNSNSGNSNSGDSNSGHWNSGNSNSGNSNSGHWNSGDSNSGHRNSGDSNSGHWNSGDSNSGNRNSGDSNSGHWNSGNSNSGNSNSGNRNSGHRNSGHSNSGHRNSGNSNSGHRNSGHWNSGDSNSGHFNTTTPNNRMFNNETKCVNVSFPSWFYFEITAFISFDSATDQQRIDNKTSIETCGGFVHTLTYKEAWKRAYDNASDEDRIKAKNLPNFDSDIFFEITGLRL